MTPDELRKLDNEVHQKVMGSKCRFPATAAKAEFTLIAPAPAYSTDIALAWMVIDRMRRRRLFASVYEAEDRGASDRWHVVFGRGDEINGEIGEGNAETPAIAICLAALKAVSRRRASAKGT